jgi:hypothetical protein
MSASETAFRPPAVAKVDESDGEPPASISVPSDAPLKLHEIALSWTYDAVSEFGRNAFRPVIGVVLIWAIFALIYAMIRESLEGLTAMPNMALLKCSMLFSVEQIFRPFYVWGISGQFLSIGDDSAQRSSSRLAAKCNYIGADFSQLAGA